VPTFEAPVPSQSPTRGMSLSMPIWRQRSTPHPSTGRSRCSRGRTPRSMVGTRRPSRPVAVPVADERDVACHPDAEAAVKSRSRPTRRFRCNRDRNAPSLGGRPRPCSPRSRSSSRLTGCRPPSRFRCSHPWRSRPRPRCRSGPTSTGPPGRVRHWRGNDLCDEGVKRAALPGLDRIHGGEVCRRGSPVTYAFPAASTAIA